MSEGSRVLACAVALKFTSLHFNNNNNNSACGICTLAQRRSVELYSILLWLVGVEFFLGLNTATDQTKGVTQ